MRDCRKDNHVVVDADWECVCCGKNLEPGDRITFVHTSTRTLGELANPQDRASVREWGPAGTEV